MCSKLFNARSNLSILQEAWFTYATARDRPLALFGGQFHSAPFGGFKSVFEEHIAFGLLEASSCPRHHSALEEESERKPGRIEGV